MKLYQVDSFADRPFKGNPAGVCVLSGEEAARAADQWMQDLAMEMNLSETAFLFKEKETYSLRWFTPAVEVDLCGHATLASAHILWSEKFEPEDSELIFNTRSGRLGAANRAGWITLDFPSDGPVEADPPEGLLDALFAGGGTGSAAPVYSGKTKFDWFVCVATEEEVRRVRPNFEALAEVTGRGVVITAPSSDSAYDFVSRFFAPAAGIPEDPVTGSAHCCLGPYWQARLKKNEFTAYQASPRGGVVKVEVRDRRTRISGKALTIFELSPRDI
ncbi:MAG: PhzF family phenazine biosynthesis protein [Spirochaetales bacterium]|nr:MAG: PhzF family phenazine biosynthesis protein [Spirochaetales bacterium]